MIKRDTTKVPTAGLNPAAGVIGDTITHYELTQSEAAKAMGIKPSLLSGILTNKRGVSAEVALRFEHCFRFSAKTLMTLQTEHDFRKAYHAKFEELRKEVVPLAEAS